MVRVRIDVSSIPDVSLNTFQGRLSDISSLSSGGQEDVFILTVFFDSKTHLRLREKLYGMRGRRDMGETGFFPMTVILEPPIT
jgi:hypothetical protein